MAGNNTHKSGARNPKFDAILAVMKDIHDRKNHDYASENNPFSNFEVIAEITGGTVDDAFRYLMAVKEARLRELLDSGKSPNFEAINDTRIDLAVYATLRAAYHHEDTGTEKS